MRLKTRPSSGRTRSRIAFGVARAVVAIVGIVALVGDFQYILGFSSFSTVNYFTYFTNQSNAAGVVVLTIGAWLSFRRPTDPGWLMTARMLTATFTIISGIVFGLIVSQAGDYNYRIVVPWSSQLLHFWIPSYVIVDWVVAPGRTRIPWRRLWLVLIYPLVWGGFTMIRGSIVGWYPYFFLDPGQVSGPLEFAAYSGAILLVIVGLAAGLIALTRRRAHDAPRKG
ncbi:Pr6Pr family membrane protein [Agreia pratensis]|uniref:Pr6Pr family membrane protein n=1 Tax=Agreia pratensis TaxID=150121 RepID=UPI000A1CD2C2|nr:Pr6Pr family membrane protein [Agreia pratensis]